MKTIAKTTFRITRFPQSKKVIIIMNKA